MAGFFDGDTVSKVLPVHIACQMKPPAFFISTLHDIHPRGLMTAEGTYKRLPLHIACMYNADNQTAIRLIQLNGKAARKKDALGRLPLHYACKDPNMDTVVAHLLREYPDGATVADKQGFLPLHVACRCGMSLPVIKILLQAAPSSACMLTNKGSTASMCAMQSKTRHMDQVVQLLKMHLNNSSTESTGTDTSDEI